MSVLETHFDEALIRLHEVGFERLSEQDRVLATLWALESDVNNGGFHQFFFNSGGDLAWFAPAALRAIGADQMARIAERANAIFGSSGPPKNWDERQARLEALSDERVDQLEELDSQFYAYPDNLAALAAAYVDRNET